jgi:hypothetical protein
VDVLAACLSRMDNSRAHQFSPYALPVALYCSKIDWSAFHKACSQHLPVYARPAFIRIVKVSARCFL